MIDHLYASHQFSIKVMYRLFQVSRSSYYAFKSHQPSQRDHEDKLIKKKIMISYLASSKHMALQRSIKIYWKRDTRYLKREYKN